MKVDNSEVWLGRLDEIVSPLIFSTTLVSANASLSLRRELSTNSRSSCSSDGSQFDLPFLVSFPFAFEAHRDHLDYACSYTCPQLKAAGYKHA